jgi:hypothetical protein
VSCSSAKCLRAEPVDEDHHGAIDATKPEWVDVSCNGGKAT